MTTGVEALLGSSKKPETVFKPGFRTSFPLTKTTIFRKFGILSGRKNDS